MRTLLLSALASMSFLAVRDEAWPTPEPLQQPELPRMPAPPPLRTDEDLTPAQIELIQYYLDSRDLEMKPHQDALREITERYDRILRRTLPPENHPAYLRMANRC